MSSDAQLARALDAGTVEAVVIHGNLADLTAEERVAYYRRVCESVGLNWYTRPFDYLNLSGKLTLYARKDCTDQLRDIHQVSVHIASRDLLEEAQLYTVTAHAARPDGRVDESTGVVSTKGLAGESLANAQRVRAETKAKRRVTLSICGLGWLDETETDTIAGAARVTVDHETGEIRSPRPGRRHYPYRRPGPVTLPRSLRPGSWRIVHPTRAQPPGCYRGGRPAVGGACLQRDHRRPPRGAGRLGAGLSGGGRGKGRRRREQRPSRGVRRQPRIRRRRRRPVRTVRPDRRHRAAIHMRICDECGEPRPTSVAVIDGEPRDLCEDCRDWLEQGDDHL